MTTFIGQYYDGCQPITTQARMEFVGREALLSIKETVEKFNIDHLKVSPRIGQTDRFIMLPNGGQFKCSDHSFLDSLPQESPSEGLVAWLEKRWGIALASVVTIICILLIGYFFGLPIAAKSVAEHIPIETEQKLGQQALIWLDKNKWLEPTNINLDKQKNLQHGFILLSKNLPFENYYHLEFRTSKFFGPNAFALPGGIIVITDEMIKVAKSPEEILAVLAHEIGHIELRHTMKSILQNSVIGIIVATITSDAASLSVAVAGLPVLLVQNKYSREFETQADEYSFKLLLQNGYSPEAFASIMERLVKDHEEIEHTFAYISTHPITKERIERARAAVKQ